MSTLVLLNANAGTIQQAHRPDEFCALSELEACETFLRKVIAKASA